MELGTSNSRSSKLHVLMFPWFAFGHINPFVQLSNKLSSHGIRVSFFSIPGNIPRIEASLDLSPPDQQVVPLDVPHVQGLDPDIDSSSDITPQVSELLKEALDQMQPQVRALLARLKPHIVLFDFAQHWLPPMASGLGIKAVHFSVFSAVSNSYLAVPSRMPDPKSPPTVDDLKRPPPGFPTTAITGAKTFQARDFRYLFKSFFGGPTVFERIMEFNRGCDATIYKTCTEIEGPYIHYLETQLGKPLLLAGPAVPVPPSGALDERWESWLGQFSESSVVFCNFGSETYLGDEQVEELTAGLELAGLPFFLVLNFGTSVDPEARLEAALPRGWRERVRGRGVVHSGWVQQQHILAHKSVGCYVNHAGFSSVIEGMVNECQLILVPQKGDQFMNSKLLSGDLRVGVEVKRRDEDGYFGRGDVAEAVRTVMLEGDREPGKSIRDENRKWREFFLDRETGEKYTEDLVQGLKALASQAHCK